MDKHIIILLVGKIPSANNWQGQGAMGQGTDTLCISAGSQWSKTDTREGFKAEGQPLRYKSTPGVCLKGTSTYIQG